MEGHLSKTEYFLISERVLCMRHLSHAYEYIVISIAQPYGLIERVIPKSHMHPSYIRNTHISLQDKQAYLHETHSV